MKRCLITSAIALSAVLAATATFADSTANMGKAHSWFVGVHGGLNKVAGKLGAFTNNGPVSGLGYEAKDLSVGYDLGATVGYYINNNVSLEGAFTFVRNAASDKTDKNNNISQLLYMANIKYHFDLGDFSPYIGAGIGLADVYDSYQGTRSDDHFNHRGFAYQGILGVDYNINSNVAIGVNYHLLSTVSPLTFNGTGKAPATYHTPFNNMFNASVTYTF